MLSWPHPDWMLYIYCGSTPTGKYAGEILIHAFKAYVPMACGTGGVQKDCKKSSAIILCEQYA